MIILHAHLGTVEFEKGGIGVDHAKSKRHLVTEAARAMIIESEDLLCLSA